MCRWTPKIDTATPTQARKQNHHRETNKAGIYYIGKFQDVTKDAHRKVTAEFNHKKADVSARHQRIKQAQNSPKKDVSSRLI
jgi:hypothetical protein